MTKRAVIIIHGRVQGVFFRDNIKKKADELNLAGWVKNELDGTVKITVQGEEKGLKELINWCYNGTKAAMVEKIDTEWQEASGEFEEFKIKHRIND